MTTFTKGLALLLASFAFVIPALAASTTTPTQAVVIARVNVQNCIHTQEGRAITITCDFINSGSIQPDIHYAVQLLKTLPKGQVLVDQKIYSETITLAANQSLHKTILYTIPSYVGGTLHVWLVANTSDGLPLALAPLGITTIEAKDGSALIVPESCYLDIPTDTKHTKYSLQQGVDIASTEVLVGHCSVQNAGTKPLTLTPVIKTYRRNTFGEEVTTATIENQSLTLKAGETAPYTFTLPHPTAPQAYDSTLTFMNGNTSITNTVAFHYVLQGPSATIQNISADKSTYQSGDTATITTFWTGSADSFPGSRGGASSSTPATITASLSSNNTLCGEASKDATKATNSSPLTTLTVPITKACTNLSLTVKLLKADGSVIASKTVTLTPSTNAIPFSASSLFYTLLALLSTLIVGVMLHRTRKQEAITTG